MSPLIDSGATTDIISTSQQQLSVVAISSIICDFTHQIATDTSALTCLLGPGQDQHVYAPTPSDRRAIENADLILVGATATTIRPANGQG